MEDTVSCWSLNHLLHVEPRLFVFSPFQNPNYALEGWLSKGNANTHHLQLLSNDLILLKHCLIFLPFDVSSFCRSYISCTFLSSLIVPLYELTHKLQSRVVHPLCPSPRSQVQGCKMSRTQQRGNKSREQLASLGGDVLCVSSSQEFHTENRPRPWRFRLKTFILMWFFFYTT